MTTPASSSGSPSRARAGARGTSIRERRAGRDDPRSRRRPALIAVAAIAGAVAVAVAINLAVGAASRVTTMATVLDASGKAFANSKVELFEFDDTPAAPARPSKLGEIVNDKAAAFELPALTAEFAVARVSVEGVGTGAFLVRRGASDNVLTVTPASDCTGIVQDAEGQALADARVEAVGKGVVLSASQTDATGKFTVRGVSPAVRFVTLRVFKAGHAWTEAIQYGFESPRPVVCKLVRTEPVSGRVTLPPSVPAATLVVQTYALPGIAAPVDASGKFVLDHVPPGTDCKLIVKGLPAGYTHRATPARAGQEVEIVVTRACQVSGTVVDSRSGQIPHLALVRHDHGPRGQETFRLDEFGRYFLANVPEGQVTIEAFTGVERAPGAPYAALQLEFAAGERKQDIGITLR